jgi:hypothetical protein
MACWPSSGWSLASTCCGDPRLAVSGATQILPRLVLGVILITTAHDWSRLAIDVNNNLRLRPGRGRDAPAEPDRAGLELDGADDAAGVPHPGGAAGAARAAQLLMRLALVDILLVLAPLAAVLWILPQTQGWAGLWAQRFVSTVFAQFVQMLALSLGLDLLTKLPNNGAAALFQPLLRIAVLAVGLKIPGLIGGALAGGNVLGTVTGAATGAAVGMGTRAVSGLALRGGVQRLRPLRRPDRPCRRPPSRRWPDGRAPDVAAPIVVARVASGLLGEDLGRWAVRLGLLALLAAAVPMVLTLLAFAGLLGLANGLSGAPAGGGPLRGGPPAEIPPDQLALMQQVAAGSTCHLPWTALATIADTESGFGANMATLSAGAIGYGQFLPATPGPRTSLSRGKRRRRATNRCGGQRRPAPHSGGHSVEPVAHPILPTAYAPEPVVVVPTVPMLAQLQAHLEARGTDRECRGRQRALGELAHRHASAPMLGAALARWRRGASLRVVPIGRRVAIVQGVAG